MDGIHGRMRLEVPGPFFKMGWLQLIIRIQEGDVPSGRYVYTNIATPSQTAICMSTIHDARVPPCHSPQHFLTPIRTSIINNNQLPVRERLPEY